MKKIAIVTYPEKQEIQPDDSLFTELLEKSGAQVIGICWDDEKTVWTDFDLVIIRSPWDYYKRENEFHLWLDKLENQKANVLNPVMVIRTNMEKSYLRKLEDSGVSIIPTRWIAKNKPTSLKKILTNQHWKKAVVKPTVSAGSYETFVTTFESAETDQTQFELITKKCGVMIQPFMDEIISNGEISMLFFNGEFSHAVLKKPQQGDFRVQPKFGSSITEFQPDEVLLKTAKSIVEKVSNSLLYARVDGIISNGKFLLMELELIEPMLFLAYGKQSAKRFADAVMERL